MSMTDLCVLAEDGVRVTLEDIGEGWDGDVAEGETPLVRFTVERLAGSEWEYVEDSSYCTTVKVTVPRTVLEKMAATIMQAVGDRVRRGESVKRVCEKLSWMQES